MSEFLVVWEYDVAPAQQAAFEKAYASDGAWAAFFSADPDYVGTRLARHGDRSGTYLTIDRWRSRAAYEAFNTAHRSRYEELDRGFAALTESERCVGTYEIIR